MTLVFSSYWPSVEDVAEDPERVYRTLVTIQALQVGLDIERLVAYRRAVEHGFYSEEIS